MLPYIQGGEGKVSSEAVSSAVLDLTVQVGWAWVDQSCVWGQAGQGYAGCAGGVGP